MTQIEVPSWVVEQAIEAMIPGELPEGFTQEHRDALLTGLRAAMGAMLVQVGYQETITVQDDGVFADVEQKLWHWIPGKPIPESTADTFREPIYVLRQEKPDVLP